MAGWERILVGCVYRPPGHIVSSAEEFFTSLKWVREKVESKVFDSSFMIQVIDFVTFSSGNVLDLVLVSKPERNFVNL